MHQSAKSGIRNVTPGQVAMLLSRLQHIKSCVCKGALPITAESGAIKDPPRQVAVVISLCGPHFVLQH